MGVGEISSSNSVQNTEIAGVGSSNAAKGKSGILKSITDKLCKGRDFIFSKLGDKADKAIMAAQSGGVGAALLGGLALAFSGIGANLTVGGIPLGIPLLAGGAALFAAGTCLLIAKISTNAGSTLGEKLKEFFSTTVRNLAKGVDLAAGLFKAASQGKIDGGSLVKTAKEVLNSSEDSNKGIGESIKEMAETTKNMISEAKEIEKNSGE